MRVTRITANVQVADLEAAGRFYTGPLTTESWGVRRFLVRAPDGTVVNVVQHRD